MSSDSSNSLQLERIVFFSDAVFAIAITLLVIEIKVPHIEDTNDGMQFLYGLLAKIPQLIGFFVSFLVIGAYWVGHHRIYGNIVEWNYGLIWRNLWLLMSIAFIPFSTAFFSDYVVHFVPLAFYAMNLAVAGLLQNHQWRYAIKHGLVNESMDEIEKKYLTWRSAMVPFACLVAILIGLISPLFAGFAFWTLPIGAIFIRRHFEKLRNASDEPLVSESET